MKLAEVIYQICKWFPKTELYGLTDQIKRASISIPSNIAEGNTRQTEKDQIHFLYIARWSCAEVETQLELAYRLWFLDEKMFADTSICIDEVSRMIVWLIQSKK
jgi:four helix bundle protein